MKSEAEIRRAIAILAEVEENGEMAGTSDRIKLFCRQLASPLLWVIDKDNHAKFEELLKDFNDANKLVASRN
jgi:hypothetical protein